MVRGGRLERLLAGGAPGRRRSRRASRFVSSARRICGSSSTTRTACHAATSDRPWPRSTDREAATGVSSSVISPPMASTKPRATVRPSPTPPSVGGRRGAGTGRTRGRGRSADTGAPVDDPQVDPSADDGGLDPHRWPSRVGPRRWPRCWPPPAPATPGRHRVGQVSGTATSMSTVGHREAGDRGDDNLLPADRPAEDVQRAALQPAHVEQVADEAG